jgi:MFS family permease
MDIGACRSRGRVPDQDGQAGAAHLRRADALYGKLGVLYGRKVVLQAAIVIFLAGSALCGLSQTMNELIAFRALQGLGGGGLGSPSL